MPDYYVMLDAPAVKVKVGGTRKVRYTNKPRYMHKNFESAYIEAKRLVDKTGFRALVLEVVSCVKPEDVTCQNRDMHE